jgi:hypothetical protein
MRSYVRHFKQDTIADCELIIRLRDAKTETCDAVWPLKRARLSAAASTEATEAARAAQAASVSAGSGEGETQEEEAPAKSLLVSFPTHQIILFDSEYFEAQVRVLHHHVFCSWTSDHRHSVP